jgi:lysophospholipase L1-like esterase
VLYGDSIFQNFELTGPEPWRNFHPLWERYFVPRQAIDLGFKGDATSHLLWRVMHGEASGITPRVAMVLIGANNFGRLAWSAEDTERGILAVLEALRARLPRTRLLLLGILPSGRGPVVAAKTAAVNASLLRRFGNDGEGPIVFLDLSPVFLKGGRLDESLFLDPLLTPPEPPLHPNVKGATWMMEALAPTLLRLWRA